MPKRGLTFDQIRHSREAAETYNPIPSPPSGVEGAQELGICAETNGDKPHPFNERCIGWRSVAGVERAKKEPEICGLCGCARGSCPHDDCQCYLHIIPKAGVEVEREEFEAWFMKEYGVNHKTLMRSYPEDFFDCWQAARATKR